MPSAGLARRALALLYEALLLSALLVAAALPFLLITRGADAVVARPLFQVYLVAVAATYFVWQWRGGGQTLPLKTWRMRIVTRAGTPLSLRHALCRFLFALAGCALAGAGFLWALVDREGLFLHDRLAGTKIVTDDL
ncbi:MAG: RDD family protein [Burkholderiales bacterium]